MSLFIGRQSLPQNFIDSVNSGMRLPQPLPQFFFANAAIAAALSSAAVAAGAGTAENFVRMMGNGVGQGVPGLAVDQYARTADAFPGMVQYVNGFGKGAGDTIKMRRPVYATGGLTQASREVNPSQSTSLVGQSITMEEIPVVLKQFEGPWDSTNSRVGPYQINDFDARFKAAKDNLAQETANHLAYDYIAWLDAVVRDLFRASTYITYANGVSNVLSFTSGAGNSINLDLLLKGRKALSDRERKPFANGRYMCIVPTIFNTDMVQDTTYRQMAATPASTEKNTLFRHLATVQDIDIFESTTLKTYSPGDTVPGDGNAVPSGTGNYTYEALMFGPEAVGFGEAEGPTMHTTADTDYGKNAKVIWRSVQAFQTLDIRGVQRLLFQGAS